MKILLNCFPPMDTHTPSISLSILKSFMQTKGYEAEVKYWNFSLSLMDDFIESDDDEETEIKLLPFLSILNDREKNYKGNKRIISLLQKLIPEKKFGDAFYYSDLLKEKKEEILNNIDLELNKIDLSKESLFGITAKYNQWIPSMVMVQELKKRAPHIKVIVGGFGSADAAEEAMNLCPEFDFTNWGEGEYPLLALMETLKSDKPDFSLVPRLKYRENDKIKKSIIARSEYLDFESYIYPDYSDFIKAYPLADDLDEVNFPINTMRSCSWKKCKFCDFNQGYKLRTRSPECIVREIKHITDKYGITSFNFVDSDTFGNYKHFEKLLDLIIDLKFETKEDYVFWAELIPNDEFDANLLKKMAIAGLKNIFIGYDGLTDSLLSKMNKRNGFADNIFFVRHSIKNGILPLVNVIKHIPSETEDDVIESINNIHYMRFFYNDTVVSFYHSYVELVFSSMSKYYTETPKDELINYNDDDLSYLMPDRFSNNDARFHLFRFKNQVLSNLKEWKKLEEIEEYYKDNSFRYKFQEHNGILYYSEYCNDEEIENIEWGDISYALILRALQNNTLSFDKLYSKVEENNHKINKASLRLLLINLKQAYLVYFNEEMTSIASVVNFQ